MCKCRDYLNLLYGRSSVLRTYNTICFEDPEINPLCFALSLQEIIFSKQILLTFIPKCVLVNNVAFDIKVGFVHYKDERILEKGLFEGKTRGFTV
uniref:NS6 protein n=1 Tax=Bird gammacoronavirus TringaCN24 TaxID=3237969 RepID=A0AB39AFC8_9GAMC